MLPGAYDSMLNQDPKSGVKIQSEGRVAYEIKIIFIVGTLMFYPLLLIFMLQMHPTVEYWTGDYGMAVAVFVCAWLALCYFALVQMVIKVNVVAFFIIIPAALLTVVSQLQSWHIKAQAPWLDSQDCTMAFERKYRLELAWQTANGLMQNCTSELVHLTGAQSDATRLLASPESCPGFVEGKEVYGMEWEYLEYLEQEYHCGGWCTQARPLWGGDARKQDSCSKAVARSMAGELGTMGLQVTVYSGFLLAASSIGVILCPNILTRK